MTIRARGRVFPVVVALSLAGAVAFVQPLSARAAEQPAPTASADAQIAWLQKQLHIAAAQMPQWNALAAAMRDNARRIALSRADRAKIHPTDVIDELYADRRETQARLERLERIIPVAEALFAALSKDQRATADRLFGGLMRGHKPILDTSD
jgi:type II secretory pathway component PulM